MVSYIGFYTFTLKRKFGFVYRTFYYLYELFYLLSNISLFMDITFNPNKRDVFACTTSFDNNVRFYKLPAASRGRTAVAEYNERLQDIRPFHEVLVDSPINVGLKSIFQW